MRLLKRLIKLGIIGYIAILLLIIFGHTGLSDVNWPFELFLSYIRHVLFIAPIVAIFAWFVWRKSVPVLIVALLITAFPLIAFNKFQKPTEESCNSEECLTVVSINFRKRHQAIETFASLDELDNADIIGLYELPFDYNEVKLREVFPGFDIVHLMTTTPNGDAYVGSFIAILSKRPASGQIYEGVADRRPGWTNRGFVTIPVELDKKTLYITAVHTSIPLYQDSAKQRNLFLRKITKRVSPQDYFILMGDFNLTPLTPEFRKLPGKRAGDPRFISTWDVQRPWTGIPIDHIMVSDSLVVIEAEVLDPVGSDHAPIMARVRLKP